MSKKLKRLRLHILISFLIFICAVLLPVLNNNLKVLELVLYLISYFVVGFEVIKKAITNIFNGHIFDENFLMTLATTAAFITNEYPEGVMVMLLYQVGELFQKYAVGKSRKSIKELMDIKPEYANIEKDGNILEIAPAEVHIGDIIVVKPGEKIPIDGVVIDGESTLDTVALTGEALPRKVVCGSAVYSGCINKTGLLRIEVTKLFEESTVSKILELVENASNKKAKAENFISKFAKYYTPIMVIAAVILAFVPPLVSKDANFIEYIHRACSFLVISCPCALVISIPLAFFSGIGSASKLGILIKGSNYIETLAKTKTIIFDKTGTLTKGVFEVTKVNCINKDNYSEKEFIELAALAETYSNHPIASSIKKFHGKELDIKRVKDIQEVHGHGVIAQIDNNEVCLGNIKLMKKMDIKNIIEENTFGTVVYLAINKAYIGNILISDKIKEESKYAIANLKANKIENIMMLTGDNENAAKYVAMELNINNFYADLLPYNKVEKLEQLLNEKKENTSVIFVGDGVNDAPVLTRADIGIAMGGLGSDAAIEAADVVIMDDNLTKINTAIDLSNRTLDIVKQNIIFALSIKLIVLILGAFGFANMWEAVFADVGVSIIAILNAMRIMKIKK